MSRHSHRTENGIVEYGYDGSPFPGYFYSVEKNGEFVEGGDTREHMICHRKEEQMNRSEIGEKLREFGVKQEHVNAVFMDRPI